MLIGEICSKSALSRDTIRFYERKGLLKVDKTYSEFNNYKNYTAAHLERLELIKKAKRFGFTLNEITELLELVDTKKAKCDLLEEKVKDKLIAIDKRIQDLQTMKKTILENIGEARSSCLAEELNSNCTQIKKS